MTWRAAMQPLSFRAFRLLLLGRLADNLAHAIAPIALAFAVLDLGGSPSQLGLVLAARAIPTVLLVLFGGVIADRLHRHLVLVVANAIGAATQALVAVLLLTGSAEIWMLASIEVVNGSASAFLFPAASGLTPQTVPASQLQPANAMLRMGHNMAFITGAAGGGLLVAAFGSGWAFAVDSALYVGGAVLLARLPIPRRVRVEANDTLRELREGWIEFTSRTWVWVVVVAFAFVNAGFAAAFATLGPIVADETVGRAAWGLVLATQAVGMVAGGLTAMRSQWERPLYVGMITTLLIVPLPLVLGFQPTLLLLLTAAFMAGFGIETFAIAWDVSLQSNVPEDRLSRVYAYDWFGSLVFIPLGQIAAGPLAAVAGVSAAVVGGGILILVATLAALLVPSIRTVRRVPEPTATSTPAPV